MREDEKRHFRAGYSVGQCVRQMKLAGKRVTTRPAHDPLRRESDAYRAYSWGFDCGVRGSACHF